MARVVAVAIVGVAIALAVALGTRLRGENARARCGRAFMARGTRCMVAGDTCPPPLLATPHGCDAPEFRVSFPDASVAMGPSDWEAEGRIETKTIQVGAFRIDAFETTRGRWDGLRDLPDSDSARAASAMTRDEAEAFCQARGGRLPTEEEWMMAAASGAKPARRYPWGDTGAVCRRAAWGLDTGPCALSGDGPDTVGAHPDGDSPLGLHDLAGNVAEWVAPDSAHPDVGIAKGGSWKTALASELRIWARLELSPSARDARVGVRCAYPPPP
jgi:formylglycine-generating enzyme required for sulfatase activity